MSFKSIVVGSFLAFSVFACATQTERSTDPVAAESEIRSSAAERDACEADDQCVAVKTLPCCNNRRVAVNKSFQDEVEEQASRTCMVVFCAPDFAPTPEDAHVPACRAGKCTLVPPPPVEPIPAEKACETTSDCVAVNHLPCCSDRVDAVNKAFQSEIEERAHRACMVVGCVFTPAHQGNVTPVCKAGACGLQ